MVSTTDGPQTAGRIISARRRKRDLASSLRLERTSRHGAAWLGSGATTGHRYSERHELLPPVAVARCRSPDIHSLRHATVAKFSNFSGKTPSIAQAEPTRFVESADIDEGFGTDVRSSDSE